jgi:hypothetical protein
MATAPGFFQYRAQAAKAARNGQVVKFRNGAYYLAPGGAQAYPGGGPAEPKSGAGGNPYAVPPRTKPTGVRPPTPPTPPPTPPVDPYAASTPDAIDKRAGDIAQAGLTPQEEEVRRQQALAASQALAQQQGIQGFSEAAAKMMAELGPQALQGYLDASKQEGALGAGLSGGVAQDVADRVASDQAFAESQGQTGGSNIDQAALKNSVYALTGQIPGDTFAEQGAAANKWGLEQAPIALNAGREELHAAMAKAAQENDQYAQQLIHLAAQFPDLKAQALQQLNQYEIDKANYRLNRANSAADNARQDRALRDQEKAAGIDASNSAQEWKYKWASLAFQSQKAAAAAQTAVTKAKAQGRQVDASASKGVGYLIGKDGQPILDAKGNRIPVQQTGNTTVAKTRVAKAKAYSTAQTAASKLAVGLRGKPATSPTYGQIGGTKGKYIASDKFKAIPQGKPGAVYPDGTTNNPKRAAYSGGATDYQDAWNKVYAQVPVALLKQYGWSDAQINSIVKKALAAAGWKRNA